MVDKICLEILTKKAAWMIFWSILLLKGHGRQPLMSPIITLKNVIVTKAIGWSYTQ